MKKIISILVFGFIFVVNIYPKDVDAGFYRELCAFLIKKGEMSPKDTIGVDPKQLIGIEDLLGFDIRVDFSSKSGIYIFYNTFVHSSYFFYLIKINNTYSIFESHDELKILRYLYSMEEKNPDAIEPDIMAKWIKKITTSRNIRGVLLIGLPFGRFYVH